MCLHAPRLRLALLATAMSALFTALPARADHPRFDVLDLSKADEAGKTLRAAGLNAAGQAVGTGDIGRVDIGVVSGPDGLGRARLGTLGGDSTAALAINDAGRVVGGSDLADGTQHPFITAEDGRTPADLGTLGGETGWASAVNVHGRVAGVSAIPGGGLGQPRRAFLTSAGGVGMRDLGTLGGTNSAAYGVNAQGEVAGSADLADGFSTHAFITDPDGRHMRDLGTFGGFNSVAHAINDEGQVVGTAATEHNAKTVAFITGPHGEGMRRATPLDGGQAVLTAINNYGVAVGYEIVGFGRYRAVILGRHDRLYPLSRMVSLPPGVWLQTAQGINDRGQIVANGSNRHAYLLTPQP